MLQYEYSIALLTPEGEQNTKIQIFQTLNSEEITTDVTAVLNYNGKEYRGRGTDYYWIDAIADLQKSLPNDVIIKCCLACRHGSMCPVGNGQNEVFCVKDIIPEDKADLYFLTEDCKERENRCRQYFDCCEDYERQSSDCFTYNDYLYYLEK